MLLAKDVGLTNVLFEGDYLQEVNVVNSQLPTHDVISLIVIDIYKPSNLALLYTEPN